jgi:4'-phosphopantetheinyl transferase
VYNTKKIQCFSLRDELLKLPFISNPAPCLPLNSSVPDFTGRCLKNEIPASWASFDAITFLTEICPEHFLFSNGLSPEEKAHMQMLKTDYSKRRFIVSRSMIKLVLQPLINAETPSDVHLAKKKTGRITIQGRDDIWISLSYSGDLIALTIAKQKIGSDIELVRPLIVQKKWPGSPSTRKKRGESATLYFLQQWTMMESFAKLQDMNLYPLKKERFGSDSVYFKSHLIGYRAMLSLAVHSTSLRDTVIWLDPEKWHTCSG